MVSEIDLMYAGQFTEADRVIVETIYDKLQKSANKALKKQASNTIAMHYEIQQDTEYAMAAEPEIGG